MATDAFGRLRILVTFTLFEYYPSAATSLTNNDVDIWVNDVVSTLLLDIIVVPMLLN